MRAITLLKREPAALLVLTGFFVLGVALEAAVFLPEAKFPYRAKGRIFIAIMFVLFAVLAVVYFMKLLIIKDELHDNSMKLAIGMTEYFSVISAISGGDYNVRASEKTGDFLIDQLGVTTNKMIDSEKEIMETALKMAEGDLTLHIKQRSEKDELGRVFGKMVENLEWILISIRDTANALSMATESMAAMTEQSSGSIEQTAEAANQIAESSVTVSVNTQKVSEESQKAFKTAELGMKEINMLTEGTKSIEEAVEMNRVAMEKLDEKTKKIGSIVKTIQEIASQTNLLSLNAAIEAARAGDAGRGFSVVAEEIGKLADDSAKWSKEIVKIIKELQNSAESAVKMAQVTHGEVKSGVSLMQSAQGKFAGIINSFEVITDEVEQIAAATEETAASSEEVSASSEEQAASVDQIAQTAQMMAETTSLLLKQMEKFKV
jgi:methyl-accepting chemotaxis protein